MSPYNKLRYKRWYEKNRAKKLEACKQYSIKHRDQKRTYDLKHYTKGKAKAIECFGTKCVLCGFDGGEELKSIQLHEIYGNTHHSWHFKYAIEHKDNFRPLCFQCHRMTHRMMIVFEMSWEDILNFRDTRIKHKASTMKQYNMG